MSASGSKSDKREIPENVQTMRAAGAKSLYQSADSGGKPGTEYFDLAATKYQRLEERPGSWCSPTSSGRAAS